MSDKENRPEKFGETPKIRPRHAGKSDSEKESGEAAEEKKRRRLLEKKSDEEWIAKLKSSDKKDDPDGAGEDLPGMPAAKEAAREKMRVEAEALEDGQEATDDEEESGEGEPEAVKEGESQGGRRRRRKKPSKPSLKRVLIKIRRRAMTIFAVVAGGILVALTFYRVGESRGEREGKEAALRDMAVLEARKVYVLPPEAQQQLDAALLEVRAGNAVAAAGTLAQLVEKFPHVASLNYAAGLGAIQAGEFETAIAFANASIEKGERVSDSYVLISIAEAQMRAEEPDKQFVNPQLRVREILDKAIAADPMSSGARMELGSLLRYMGDEPGALTELGAAKARLHPVDSHLAVDVTVGLIEVENLPLEALQPTEPTADDVRVLFPAAYIAMRHENFELGIRLLNRCKNLLPVDSFHYLVNDRAFQSFAYRDDVKALMQ
ncbi:MAG: hypothetical protein WEB60_14725 [Terrimicrobiaceae bacterium]